MVQGNDLRGSRQRASSISWLRQHGWTGVVTYTAATDSQTAASYQAPTRTRASDSPARSAISTELRLECAAGWSHGRRYTLACDTAPCSRASCRRRRSVTRPSVHLRDLAGGARASAPCPAYQYTGSNRDYGGGVARSAGAIPSAPVRRAQAAAPPDRGRGRTGRSRASYACAEDRNAARNTTGHGSDNHGVTKC